MSAAKKLTALLFVQALAFGVPVTEAINSGTRLEMRENVETMLGVSQLKADFGVPRL